MERNAIDLALAGQQYYLYGNRTHAQGVSISVNNYSEFRAAVGGGIWYEPFIVHPHIKYVCFYAFYDTEIEAVRYDPNFETDEYDYHTQMWYTTIKAGSSEESDNPFLPTFWTAPYYDDTGTNALMTTVGSPIYDDNDTFIGVSTVDWILESMLLRLSLIRPTENSFVLLLCPKTDKIISYTYDAGKSLIGESISELSWFNIANLKKTDDVSFNLVNLDNVNYFSFSKGMSNGWIMAIQIPTNEIFKQIDMRNAVFICIMGLVFIFGLYSAFYFTSIFINKPIKKLTSEVIELGSGNLNKQIKITSKDEIGTLATAFNKMTIDLKASIEEIARESAEKERIGAELNIATQIQYSLLPCIFPPFPEKKEFDIFASMSPAKEVGGDFYDFFLLDDDTLAIIIADVSGKGVPAALFMVITKTLLKNNAQQGKSPKEVFETVNNLLCENNDAMMFVTVFLGYIDLPSGNLTYVNAGHNPPLIYTKSQKSFTWLKGLSGFVLAGCENMLYQENKITLSKGDKLFLYTDGITEAINISGSFLGEGKLLEMINKYKNKDIKELAISIKNDIDDFSAGIEQADDITMLILKINED